jgi:poly(ADP-ribose) glycohydrolase ARH3
VIGEFFVDLSDESARRSALPRRGSRYHACVVTLEQTQGCLLGLALADAVLAQYEGGIFERSLWWVIGTTRRGEMRWTDDTQMTIDVVESYLAAGAIDADDLAMRFARSYRWSRGYGPGAAKVLKRIAAGTDWRQANRSVFAAGSFGNGAAMRAPMIGLIYAQRPAELLEAVRASAVVTHAHPLAVEGATLLAVATAGAVRGASSLEVFEEAASRISLADFVSRLTLARAWLESSQEISRTDVIRYLGNRVAAHESCVTAVYLALRFRDQPFVVMQQFIAACGGDADTIGAMVGAIWGAANGYSKLPQAALARLEQRERLLALARSLHGRID